jgi:type IV pilus assembly protein PilA
MKLNKVARGQSGFTLIELMIVVGIIGILVAIAAPNFARYQSKARQSEAKIALGAIYAAEKSFYAEYSAYVASLDLIGYAPEGSKRFYSVGFNSQDTTAVSGVSPGQLTTTTTTSGISGATVYSIPRVAFPSTWTQCTPTLAAGTAAGDNPQGFVAAASGQVRQNTACDNWQITQDKALTNTLVSL